MTEFRCSHIGHFTFWISPLAHWNRYVYSQASRSNYCGYLHALKYLVFIIKHKLWQLDVCKPTRLHHSFLLWPVYSAQRQD